MSGSLVGTLTNSIQEFQNDGYFHQMGIVKGMQDIKWNFKEFTVRYSVDRDKIKVWRYYLKSLITKENTLALKLETDSTKKLWEFLELCFRSSQNTED